jgi:hypothetical protein
MASLSENCHLGCQNAARSTNGWSGEAAVQHQGIGLRSARGRKLRPSQRAETGHSLQTVWKSALRGFAADGFATERGILPADDPLLWLSFTERQAPQNLALWINGSQRPKAFRYRCPNLVEKRLSMW